MEFRHYRLWSGESGGERVGRKRGNSPQPLSFPDLISGFM